MSALRSIESEGGPVILIPEEAAAGWQGTQNDDYQRACDDGTDVLVGGADFVRVVSVGDQRALAMDGGAALAFTRLGAGGLLIRAADLTEAQAHEAAAAVKQWQDTKHTWVLPSGKFVAFTAAQAFVGAEPVLQGEVAPGTYRVEGVETNYGDSWVTMFRLTPA